MSFVDFCTWNVMLNPEQFDIEMSEASGITGN